MSRYAKEAVTQQADFGLSHRISPREIFMLLGGIATSSHRRDRAVEVEISMGSNVPPWVIIFFGTKFATTNTSLLAPYFSYRLQQYRCNYLVIPFKLQNSPKPLAI